MKINYSGQRIEGGEEANGLGVGVGKGLAQGG